MKRSRKGVWYFDGDAASRTLAGLIALYGNPSHQNEDRYAIRYLWRHFRLIMYRSTGPHCRVFIEKNVPDLFYHPVAAVLEHWRLHWRTR